MLFREVVRLLEAEVLNGSDQMGKEVFSACASDMMSDVLAFAHDDVSLLMTGLLNQQVIRTAEMKDILCVCFVRDKRPDAAIIKLAEEKEIIIMRTAYRMYEACGLLYAGGLGMKEGGA